MAQLSDDCFAFGGPLLSIENVERLIGERVVPVAETESVSLKEARGRVLAADVVAPIYLPPFDNSAVDGYAVRHAGLDSASTTRLAVVERVTAGAPFFFFFFFASATGARAVSDRSAASESATAALRRLPRPSWSLPRISESYSLEPCS